MSEFRDNWSSAESFRVDVLRDQQALESVAMFEDVVSLCDYAAAMERAIAGVLAWRDGVTWGDLGEAEWAQLEAVVRYQEARP